MNPTPDGWPRISSCLFYEEPKRAIEWLCKAFGFELRLLVETGAGGVAHSELVYGEGVIMVGTNDTEYWKSPRRVGGCTQSVMVMVDDVEAHLAQAKAHGAEIYRELAISDYGEEYWSDRTYGALDCEGHRWWFSQRIKTGNPDWSTVRNKHEKHG